MTVRCGTKCHKALCDCKQWIERLDHLSYVIVTYCRLLQNYLHFLYRLHAVFASVEYKQSVREN